MPDNSDLASMLDAASSLSVQPSFVEPGFTIERIYSIPATVTLDSDDGSADTNFDSSSDTGSGDTGFPDGQRPTLDTSVNAVNTTYEYDRDGNLIRSDADEFRFVNISAPMDDGSIPVDAAAINPGGPFDHGEDDSDPGGFNPPPLTLDDPEPDPFDFGEPGMFLQDGDAIL